MTKRGNVIPLRPHAVVAGERLQTLERIDQFQLYDLACAVHPLVELDDDTSHVKALGRLAVASKKLDELLSDDPPARLTVIARPAAEDLRTKVNELVCTSAADRKKRRLTASEAEPFADSDLMPVRKAAERFEIALQSEMAASVAFVVPKRGIFDTDELVNYASRSLPAEFKAFMPDKAHNEITSAGRCLAFGLYSAVGFHICRAVEAVMEAYYTWFSGKSGPLRSWHDYIEEFERLGSQGKLPPAAVQTIASLAHLKQMSRNPIMHPRLVLRPAEAESLFFRGVSTMCEMARDMQSSEPVPLSAPRIESTNATPMIAGPAQQRQGA